MNEDGATGSAVQEILGRRGELEDSLGVTSEYPFPVARAFSRLLACDDPVLAGTMADVVEHVTYRYVAHILVSSNIARQGPEGAAFDRKVQRAFVTHERMPTEGHLKDLVGALLGYCRRHPERAPMAPLLRWPPRRRALAAEGTKQSRNRRSHSGAIPGPSYLRELAVALDGLAVLLEDVAFLRDYDLLVAAPHPGQPFRCLVCRGAWPDRFRAVDATELAAPPTPGEHHVRVDGGGLLALQPLFLPWEDSAESTLFQSLHTGQEYAWYLPVTRDSERKVVDPAVIAALGEIQRFVAGPDGASPRAAAPPLDVRALTEACAAVSGAFLGRSEKQNEPAVHLPRGDLWDHVHRFLGGPERFFVIVGDSGVGKTTFLTHVRTTLADSEDQFVVFLDAGALPSPSGRGDLLSVVLDLLAKEAGVSEWPATSILDLLEASGARLLVLLDALNESPNPRELFAALDRTASGFPRALVERVQVMVTVRPGAWSRLSGSRDPAQYYAASSEGGRFVRLEPFAPGDELRQAWERYRTGYQLSETLEDLPPALRALIRNPLCMRLAAEAGASGDADPGEGTEDLVSLYLSRRWHREGWSLEEDVEGFLQGRLVPRLAHDRVNVLRTGDLVGDRFRSPCPDVPCGGGDGKRCLPASCRDLADRLWEPERNASFLHLTRAGVLAERLTDRFTFQVQFQHERFYDHFLGVHHASEVAGLDPAGRARAYGDLADAVEAGKVYLFGAIRTALVAETARPDGPRVLADFLRGGALVRERLVLEGLSELVARDGGSADTARTVIRALYDQAGPTSGDAERSALLRRTAVRAAAVAGQESQPLLLDRAILDPSDTIRRVAAESFFRFWRAEREAGTALLRERFGTPAALVRRMSGSGRQATLSFLADIASRVCLSAHDQFDSDPHVLAVKGLLLGLVGPVLFGDRRRGSAWGRLLRLPARSVARALLVPWATSRAGELLSRLRAPDGRRAFPLDADDRVAMERLLRYADPRGPRRLNGAALDALRGAVARRYSLPKLVGNLVCLSHAASDTSAILGVLRVAFEEHGDLATRDSVLSFLETIGIWTSVDVVPLMEELTDRFVSENEDDLRNADLGRVSAWHTLEHVARTYCDRARGARRGQPIPMVVRTLRELGARDDPALLRAALVHYAALAVTNPASTLVSLEAALPDLDLSPPDVREAASACIAAARVIDPGAADAFFRRNALDDDLRRLAESRVDPEVFHCIDDFGWANASKTIFVSSDAGRAAVLDFFGHALRARTTVGLAHLVVSGIMALAETGWRLETASPP